MHSHRTGESNDGGRQGALGLGMAALGRPGYINLGHGIDLREGYDVEALRKRAHAVLDAAYGAGVRYFDTARSYGRGEEFLGSWLSSRGSSGVTIASKWGYTYTADWQVQAAKHEVKDHSLATLHRQWPESQEALGGKPDLYQIHSATLESGVLEDRAVHRELAVIREQGVRIGLSLSGPAQNEILERALAVQIDGRPLFAAVQATFNLLEQSAAPALSLAHEQGLLVIVKEGVANGRLTARNSLPADAIQLERIKTAADHLTSSIDCLALGFVLAQPWVDIALSGAATVEQLESNLAALELSGRAAEALEALGPAVVQAPETYWQIRADLPWQ